MGFTRLLDANGAPFNADNNVVGSNVAFTMVPADQAGNKFTLAPGLVGLPVQLEGIKNTYHYSVLGFAPVATPTDILEIQGSGTKTGRIRAIFFDGVATAAGNMPVQLIRRSAADTTSLVRTALTAFKPDLGAGGVTPAATLTVSTIGTANPGSLGAQVGGIGASGRVQFLAVGSGVGAERLQWVFDVNACVLRGVSDFLYLNLNGAAVPAGGVIDIRIVVQEDAS